MCSRQHPTGVDEDSSASVMVLLVPGLVHVDDRLPRLHCDVALPAPKHAKRRLVQGVVQPLTTCCCRDGTMVKLLPMVTITGNAKVYFHHGCEADLPPLLPFVMGARGPDVVSREGRLARKRGRTGISNPMHHGIYVKFWASTLLREVTYSILGCHTTPRSAEGSCRCNTMELHHYLDSCWKERKNSNEYLPCSNFLHAILILYACAGVSTCRNCDCQAPAWVHQVSKRWRACVLGSGCPTAGSGGRS